MSEQKGGSLELLEENSDNLAQEVKPIVAKSIEITIPEPITEKFILIKRRAQSRIPVEIMEDAYQGFGGSLNENTKDILRGLSFKEEAIILPNIVGMPATSDGFIAATKAFWCNIEVEVPSTGIKLNITTVPTKVKINGVEEIIDIPNVPEDYVKYRLGLVHNQVAKNKEAADNYETPYYFEDSELEEKLEMDKLQEVYKARKRVEKFLDLSKPLTDPSQNFTAVQAICKLSSETHNKPIPIDRKGLVRLVDELCTLYPATVITLSDDKSLQDRLFVDMLIDANIIKLIGNEIYDEKLGKDPIALGIDNYILFINTQSNRAIKSRLTTELKAKSVSKY